MRTLTFILILFFNLSVNQNGQTQNNSYQFAIGTSIENTQLILNSHQAINPKYRGRLNEGFAFSKFIRIGKKINKKWLLQLDYINSRAKYELVFDRDFGDIDLILNFSEPTLDGDDQNFYQLNFQNKYRGIALNLNYLLLENTIFGKKTSIVYVGVGCDWKNLIKSTFDVHFSDFSNQYGGIIKGWSSANNLATPSQIHEATEFYTSSLVKNSFFLKIKLGFKMFEIRNLSLMIEPNVAHSIRSFNPKFTKTQINFGVNAIFTLDF